MTADTYAEAHPASEFLSGVRASIPVIVAAAPFGVLFGALAVENGFSASEAMLMSAAIFGGASQMVGIDLFGARVAPWLIVFSIFAVNFRHVLYSATIGRYIAHWTPLQRFVGFFFLVDPQFAEAEQRVEKGRSLGFAWYMGVALPLYVFWIAESGLGAVFGRLIPNTQALGLDFLLPIYFLGLVMSFRKRAMWLPVVGVSAFVSVVAYHTIGSPWHVSIGAVAGVLVGALFAPKAFREKRP
ncbi:AzlC family ABC transporter permease [Chelativorans sp. SCAU2101]|jgi:Predicted branched-chain amino acid permease (azaleucine resistance)|uniref:AzlC family ABC transporter permease n=1 Tax=Chelativorans petroleitrophicus TaxID=2975484 RepID=A0A9X3AZR7_9HYPH|nr:AzlC family ABC transporter permease [Chelativorans petroleitrophicus]MCT8990635.1 AzlC family ABC transporter permease [Chelativorans petroleitrophicus]